MDMAGRSEGARGLPFVAVESACVNGLHDETPHHFRVVGRSCALGTCPRSTCPVRQLVDILGWYLCRPKDVQQGLARVAEPAPGLVCGLGWQADDSSQAGTRLLSGPGD
jgi:hypothetical protein